jgi:hypothetical protein
MRYLLALLTALTFLSTTLVTSPVLAGGKNGEKVTIDQVPAPVKATIEKEAKGSGVADITKESQDGKVYYEAQIKQKGMDRYVQVAPDGKVLKRLSAKEEAKDEVKGSSKK